MAEQTATNILVVDDEPSVCHLVSRLLEKHGYVCNICNDSAEAIEKIESGDYKLVISDIMMPEISGIELLAIIKKTHPDMAFIMLTAIDDHETAVRALDLGAFGYVIKPFEANELLINVANSLRRRELEIERNQYEDRLEREVWVKTAEVRAIQEQITLRLITASGYRDEETGAHIRRMGEYAAILARAIGLEAKAVEEMRLAAPMHDVGKIGITDAILRKPSKLTDKEFVQMKEHTTIGAHILEGSNITLLNLARDIALYHHEKWNGSGYPLGLRGEDIPLCARIVAICDVYDALVNDRVYRPAVSEGKALAIIKEGQGVQFDPRILDIFLEQLPQFHAVREKIKE
jgi:putative two-component system response regulator